MDHNLLLLHGALGTKDQFLNLKKHLSPKFNVHDFNFEGHGTHASNKDFSIPLFTENVIEYLNENQITQTHIFGYSMGGYVGLDLANKYQNRVNKIITLGTKFDWTRATAEKEIRMLNPEKIAEKVPAFAKNLASIHINNNWKDVVKRTAQMMYNLGEGARLKDQELASIKHEVLLCVGSKDRMVSIEESKVAAEILPNGKLEIIEGFPHSIEKINEAMFASIIIDFIKEREVV